MSDMRKTWRAVCRYSGVGVTLRSRYLRGTLKGSSYMVTLPLEIIEGGRGHVGREVNVEMHPDQARRLATSLLEYAHHAEQLNVQYGHQSSEQTEAS